MNDKQRLDITRKLKTEVQRGFGKSICKELNFDCASCKAQSLIGHLNWYIDLLEYMVEEDKKSKSKK
jgi:hypothetical protein